MSSVDNLFATVDANKGGAPIFNRSGAPEVNTKEDKAEPEDKKESKELDTPSNTKEPTDGWEKRYKDLQSFKDQQVTEYKDKIKSLEEKLSAATKPEVVLPKSKEDIEKFKQENKDLFDSIETMIKTNLIEADKEYSSKIESLKLQHQEVTVNQKQVELLKKHPDAKSIKDSPEFKEWYQKQSAGVKGLFTTDGSVEDWVVGFNLYKGTLSAKESQTKAAESVVSNSKGQVTKEKKVYKESEIQKKANSSPHWWEKNRDKILEAEKEGRIEYDLSKK